jgi:hypothetical protein
MLALAGRLRAALAVQAVFIVPLLLHYGARYARGWDDWVIYGIHLPLMLGGFALLTGLLARVLRDGARGPAAA